MEFIYKIKDNQGVDYKIKDIKKFAKHIFEFHTSGSSLHQENGRDFIVNDEFRKKVAELIKKEKK